MRRRRAILNCVNFDGLPLDTLGLEHLDIIVEVRARD
jgi:hypothetical protein